MDSSKTWLNARTLYDDLAIPHFHMSFEDWFTARVQGEFKINTDWTVNIEKDPPEFWITQAVYDQVAYEEIGLPGIRVDHMTDEEKKFVKRHGWNEKNRQQTHAITGDDEI